MICVYARPMFEVRRSKVAFAYISSMSVLYWDTVVLSNALQIKTFT